MRSMWKMSTGGSIKLHLKEVGIGRRSVRWRLKSRMFCLKHNWCRWIAILLSIYISYWLGIMLRFNEISLWGIGCWCQNTEFLLGWWWIKDYKQLLGCIEWKLVIVLTAWFVVQRRRLKITTYSNIASIQLC